MVLSYIFDGYFTLKDYQLRVTVDSNPSKLRRPRQLIYDFVKLIQVRGTLEST